MKRLMIAGLFLTGVFLTTTATKTVAQGTQQTYEYRVVKTGTFGVTEKAQMKAINKMAAQGWRLIEVGNIGGTKLYFYFERKLN